MSMIGNGGYDNEDDFKVDIYGRSKKYEITRDKWIKATNRERLFLVRDFYVRMFDQYTRIKNGHEELGNDPEFGTLEVVEVSLKLLPIIITSLDIILANWKPDRSDRKFSKKYDKKLRQRT